MPRTTDPTPAAPDTAETNGKNVSRRGVLKRAAVVAAGAGGASLLLSRKAFAAATTQSNVVYLDGPVRLLDTRAGQDDLQTVQTTTPIAANGTKDFVVGGLGGIPAGATGVFGNLVAATPTNFGNLLLFATGQTPIPVAATIVFGTNMVGNYLANHAASRIGAAASCTLQNQSSGTTHAIFDAVGYILDDDGLGTP